MAPAVGVGRAVGAVGGVGGAVAEAEGTFEMAKGHGHFQQPVRNLGRH